MREVVLAHKGKGFSITRPEVRHNKYAEHLGVVPKNVRFTKSVYAPGKKQRIFYFQPTKLGEGFLNFHEGESVRHDCRIYVRPTNGIEIVRMPDIHVTTSVTTKQRGKKTKTTTETYTHKCLKINGIEMKIPEDFEDLLNELCAEGVYGLKVNYPIGSRLFAAGLMLRSNRGYGYGSTELRKNKAKILESLT